MKGKVFLGVFLLTVVIVFSFTKNKTYGGKSKSIIVLKATEDFEMDTTLLVPTYKDKNRNALAINASISKDEFAKAHYTFPAKENTFTLKFTSLTETDGESTYRILINNKLISQFQNPETTIDYMPYVHTVDGVRLKKGEQIQIEFNSHSNGKISEGDIFAYSRGRWTTLQLIPESTD